MRGRRSRRDRGRVSQLIGNLPQTPTRERWLAAAAALAKDRYGP